MAHEFERAREQFLAGVQAFEAQRLEAAQAHFEAARALLPGRPSTLLNLAATHLRRAAPEQALPVLDELLAADPQQAEAWRQRGIALADLARPAEALDAFDRARALDPADRAAQFHRALALGALGRHAQALAALDALLALDPDRAPTWMHRGLMLQRLDRHEEALPAYDRAIALDPTLGRAWSLSGAMLKDAGRLDEAAHAFEQALRHGDDEALNRFLLASARSAGQPPPTAPRHYVQGLFDAYAPTFDDHLVQVLRYRAPELLVAQLDAIGLRRFDAALDLGCGTGLLGPLLAHRCAAIDGVDLSSTMIEAARARGTYRRLVRADLAEHLAQTTQRYDLVAATDVFIYVGALEAVFRGVRRVLGPGGVFAFTVERGRDEQGFELRHSGRYAHSARYLGGLAQRHGFDLLSLQPGTLREEQQRPIDGLAAVLRVRDAAGEG